MSIQTEINRIITAIGNAYTAIQNKGGTLPQNKTVANLAQSINTISSGGGGAVRIEASSVTESQLVFNGSSGYSHYSIFFETRQSYSAQSYLDGFYSYSRPDDNKFHAFYCMNYGSRKVYVVTNNSEDEVKRSGNNFNINSSYVGIGMKWITNTTQGKYVGYFW